MVHDVSRQLFGANHSLSCIFVKTSWRDNPRFGDPQGFTPVSISSTRFKEYRAASPRMWSRNFVLNYIRRDGEATRDSELDSVADVLAYPQRAPLFFLSFDFPPKSVGFGVLLFEVCGDGLSFVCIFGESLEPT